mmetsp:Transcript_102936/g.154309  ORF Transcript_102936/g.154309 Transcript_102936/m.154309 type:complete len:251 (+) Transcript_102936:335-1087(+)
MLVQDHPKDAQGIYDRSSGAFGVAEKNQRVEGRAGAMPLSAFTRGLSNLLAGVHGSSARIQVCSLVKNLESFDPPASRIGLNKRSFGYVNRQVVNNHQSICWGFRRKLGKRGCCSVNFTKGITITTNARRPVANFHGFKRNVLSWHAKNFCLRWDCPGGVKGFHDTLLQLIITLLAFLKEATELVYQVTTASHLTCAILFLSFLVLFQQESLHGEKRIHIFFASIVPCLRTFLDSWIRMHNQWIFDKRRR